MSYPFDASPATVWTLARECKVATCQIAFVPIGVEARILRDGKLLYARTFPNGDDTLEWAEEQRQGHLARGWTITQVAMP
jgi:hypothetical protein